MRDTKDLSQWRKIRKVLKIEFLSEKLVFSYKKTKKTKSPEVTSKVFDKLLIRNYEQVKFFCKPESLILSEILS